MFCRISEIRTGRPTKRNVFLNYYKHNATPNCSQILLRNFVSLLWAYCEDIVRFCLFDSPPILWNVNIFCGFSQPCATWQLLVSRGKALREGKLIPFCLSIDQNIKIYAVAWCRSQCMVKTLVCQVCLGSICELSRRWIMFSFSWYKSVDWTLQ